MKTTILGATLAATLAASVATTAHAAPLLQAMVFDDGIQVGTVQSSTFGLLQFTLSDANFSAISVTADGIGLLPSPDFATQTTKVSSGSSFSGSHDLRIVVSQTGITGFPAGLMGFASTFGANFLVNGSGVKSDILSTYIDAGNAAFATTTQLASTNCAIGPVVCAIGPITTAAPITSGAFSETEVFDAVFTAGGTALQSNAQIVGSAVPEPVSMTILGAGMLGLGLARRRRA